MSPLFAAAWLLVATCTTVAAQEAVSYASVSGRVTDPQGAVVSGASIGVRHVNTNVTATTVTDGEGRFRFPFLRVGSYEMSVRAPGFADFARMLQLDLGSALELHISLAIGDLKTAVTVSGEGPVLESARSQIGATISRVEVRDVPLNGRQSLDLALLTPGVSPTNTGSTQLFAETSAVPGQGISVGSQRNLSNNFVVDGLSANDDAAGVSGMPYGLDAVEELQVVTAGGQAELGRALGGYVNIVTKSGTNTTSGDVYGYFRDDRFNAPNALSGTRLPMSQTQYGVSAGGPIRRDRTFFFSNVEQRQLDQSGLSTIVSPAVDVINARLADVRYPGQPVATGLYPNPMDTANVLAKIDHQLSGPNHFSVRYSFYGAASSNSRGAGGLNAPSGSSNLDSSDHAVAVSNTMTLSSRTVNEIRTQWMFSDLLAPPSDPVGPNVTIAGVAAFGTLSSSPQRRLNRMLHVVESLSHQRGAHAWRVGGEFIYNSDTITFPRSVRGTYAFSSLQNFLGGTYNNAGFTQTFGDSVVSQTNPNFGVYVQDEWKAHPALTLNLGVRYDVQYLETIAADTSNISPRAGFAWTPSGTRTTVVRGSAGMFYDRVPLRAVANALLSAGNTTDVTALRQVTVSLSPTQAGAPAFPNILPAPVPSVTLPSLTTIDRHLQSAYSRQAGIEFERQVGLGATVSVGYQYLRGQNLLIAINKNVPTCLASGTNNGCRPNADYANNNQYSSEAESNYHGLYVSFVQRPSSWGHYRVSYTLSRSMNNVGEFFFSAPIDPTDLSKDWGRSDDDQRHRFVFNGSVNSSMAPASTLWDHLNHGFQLSAMVQAYSKLPLNITSGATTVQGTAGRPVVDGEFIPRNSGAGADFFSVGVRLMRSFRVRGSVRIEGAVEVFNLTNRTNVVTRNANFGGGEYPTNPAPTYYQITAVGDPRAFQFALRLRF